MPQSEFKILSQEYSRSFKSKDWENLAQIGLKLGAIIGGGYEINVRDIHEISKRYLGALIGSGDSLLSKNDNQQIDNFVAGLGVIENLSSKSTFETKSSLSPIIKSAYEIQLFLTTQSSDARNKAAKALRVIARPDLSIALTSIQIASTRLNYYSLVVRASAYSDLAEFSNAIRDGLVALKYSPKEKSYYALVTLARAYVERFKQNGDIQDSEIAFDYAEKAFEQRPDEYSANTFLKVIHTIGLEGMDDLISSLKNVRKNLKYELDQKAIEIAKDIIKNSKVSIPQKNVLLDDLLASALIDHWLVLDIDEDLEDVTEDSEIDSPEDYFEDYFEEYNDSLLDPQSPHLEP